MALIKDPQSREAQRYLNQYKDKAAMPIFCLDDTNAIYDKVRKFTAESPMLGRILYERYICDKELEDIGTELGYSYTSMKRYHAEALYRFYKFTHQEAIPHGR